MQLQLYRQWYWFPSVLCGAIEADRYDHIGQLQHTVLPLDAQSQPILFACCRICKWPPCRKLFLKKKLRETRNVYLWQPRSCCHRKMRHSKSDTQDVVQTNPSILLRSLQQRVKLKCLASRNGEWCSSIGERPFQTELELMAIIKEIYDTSRYQKENRM